jgi:hypothetical protein
MFRIVERLTPKILSTVVFSTRTCSIPQQIAWPQAIDQGFGKPDVLEQKLHIDPHMKALLAFMAMTLGLPLFVLAQETANVGSPQGASETISPVGDELNWPRVFTNNNAVVAIYQPEIEKWVDKDWRPGRVHCAAHNAA